MAKARDDLTRLANVDEVPLDTLAIMLPRAAIYRDVMFPPGDNAEIEPPRVNN